MSRPKYRGETKALNIQIDAKISDILSKASEKSGITKTRIVENAVKEYIEKNKDKLNIKEEWYLSKNFAQNFKIYSPIWRVFS